MDEKKTNIEIEKINRLIEYLLNLSKVRRETIRDINSYEKVVWFSDIPHEEGCFAQVWRTNEDNNDSAEWLIVQSRKEPELPKVPDKCKDWIKFESLKNKNDIPELLPKIIKQVPNPNWSKDAKEPEAILKTEYLKDYPEIQQIWNMYLEKKWLPWVEEHNAWEKVYNVYSKLFAIRQELLRLGEEYELIIGLGLLTWQTPTNQRIRRHLIVADAIMEFEAHLNRFTVKPDPKGINLRIELDMLDIEEFPDSVEKIKKDLSTLTDNPWDKSTIDSILKSLVNLISPKGIYENSLETKNIKNSVDPIVEYAPALILRKRSNKGLTGILKGIKEQIKNIEKIPSEFATLAEIHRSDNYNDQQNTDSYSEEEIFFPKPYNEEQLRIVRKIKTSNGVLVQGPPGTGKSHTIANLICHLLATGNRVLITAKTSRALEVLENLLSDELKPLCINLLGDNDLKSLDYSINNILRKNEEWDEDKSIHERKELTKKLKILREEKAKIERRLWNIRESERYSHFINESYSGTAARIAEKVNKNKEKYEWFTDSVPLDMKCPISSNILSNILESLREFTLDKRKELNFVWPETNSLLSPEDFKSLVEKEADFNKEEQRLKSLSDEYIVNILEKTDLKTVKTIHKAFSDFLNTYRRFSTIQYSWINEALTDILNGKSYLWREILQNTKKSITSIEPFVKITDETKIEFPENIDIKTLYKDTLKLKEHIENGGELGWWIFRPQPVKDKIYVFKNVKIDGKLCSEEDLPTLHNILYSRIEFEKIWKLWEKWESKIEGPYTLQLTKLKALSDTLEKIFELEKDVVNCQQALNKYPNISGLIYTNEFQIKKIIYSCDLLLCRFDKKDINEEIRKIQNPISKIVENNNVHPITYDLLKAIHTRNIYEYKRLFDQIKDLDKQRFLLKNLDKNISKLRQILPKLTDSLEKTYNKQYWEEKIKQIEDAWNWAQAKYWIEEYINKEDVSSLTQRLKQIEDDINSIIAQLSALHAWSFFFSRLKDEHRRHIKAWQQAMRRLGKGTGKHAPRHMREAQEHLNKFQEAIPVLIMPLHRVFDTVSPAPGIFDVVIVDEASQCGFEGIPLFYLGKKIVIVGDDKQISPEVVGLDRNILYRLREEFLYDFQFKSLFNIETSLFDYGKFLYDKGRITLREHFRCMPEIISFSNDLCYSDTPLIPLRQYNKDRLPPLKHVFVSTGYNEGEDSRLINRPEAEAIVSKIVELCNDKRYDGKTMGVIVLQGKNQAKLIENLLLEQLSAEEINRRRLICGDPYSFQGDERDIIFLSLVVAPNKRISPLAKSADEQRFNVATSRARDQMILFYSIKSSDLSPKDLRKRLIEFFEKTNLQNITGIDKDEIERKAKEDNRSLVKPPKPFESWFEVDVALEILRRGYVVIPQYKFAGKRIDLVVEGGQSRLAVECDGDYWHGSDRYEEDMQRQRQLERCGWEFFRVRASEFYLNKEKALRNLWKILEERSIYPQTTIKIPTATNNT